jgi:putative (di)nucleoside polyphosphate hydrolase
VTAERDPSRYRPNVGLAVFNKRGEVFIGRRVGAGPVAKDPYQWQMPQGGVDDGESAREAALRELEEEIGIDDKLVDVLDETEDWIYYEFPPDVRRAMERRGNYLGQRQKWFALRFLGQDSDVHLDRHTPEFDAWRWAKLNEVPPLVIPFKRAVYDEVARRFSRFSEPV